MLTSRCSFAKLRIQGGCVALAMNLGVDRYQIAKSPEALDWGWNEEAKELRQ